jgi:DUF4097 and DUF4098 domain-containing protein YvlB
MRIARQRLLTAVAVIAVTYPLTACELATASFRAEAKEPWSQTFQVASGARFELENTNGSIDVESATGSEIEVRAERIAKAATEEGARELLKQVEIVVDATSDRVAIRTKYPSGWNRGGSEVRYWVKVPATVAVKVENTNGKVKLAGLAGAVEASTTNGGVSGEGLSGRVRASTTNGGVDISVTAVHAEGIDLSTTNGGVKLVLPASAKADVSARCTNGGISASGLSIETAESSRRRLEGRLNGGGPRVRLETTNGGIRLTSGAGPGV